MGVAAYGEKFKIVQNCPKLSKIVQNWIKIVKTGLTIVKTGLTIVKYYPKRIKIVKYCQILSKIWNKVLKLDSKFKVLLQSSKI